MTTSSNPREREYATLLRDEGYGPLLSRICNDDPVLALHEARDYADALHDRERRRDASSVFLRDGAARVEPGNDTTWRFSDVHPLQQDAEEVSPASLGVTLMGPQTWADGTPKKLVWVQLAICGRWEGHVARPFELTSETFDQAKRNFDARGVSIVWDYDHASEQDATDGNLAMNGAPAWGWIHRLQNRQLAGLWGATEWLDKARDGIRAGEFAFCSPSFRFGCRDQVTGKPIGARITSCAITHQPFLSRLEGLRAANDGASRPRGLLDASPWGHR